MDKGKFGEDFTAKYLQQKGYEILKQNYHSRYGEIDIIAINHEFIAFVEVKTRSTKCNENPSVFVDYKKQTKLIKTAYIFLQSQEETSEILNLQPRFDVSAIIIDAKRSDKVVCFDYFTDCFYANYNS